MGKRKKFPVLENISIIDIGAEGKAIAKTDNQIIFVPFAVPGDIIDVQITKKKKKYLEGYPVTFHKFSRTREKPFCGHFGICGGCKWQNLPYSEQLKYKEKEVIENLTRIGKTSLSEIRKICSCKKNIFYRNKLEFTFSTNRWLTDEEVKSDTIIKNRNALGFHIRGKFDRVLDIHKCYLQPEPSNKIRMVVKKYALQNDLTFFNQKTNKGFLRNLIIRNNQKGEIMLIMVFGEEDKKKIHDMLDYVFNEFPEIISVNYIINRKVNDSINDLEVIHYKGESYLIEEFDHIRFRISPKAFFQTNTQQAYNLYTFVEEFAKLTGNEIIYDLYTGIGSIALFIAGSCKKTVGIEYVADAIKNARENAKLNNISNAHFYSGDIKDVLTNDFILKNGTPDIIIADPPRAGMHASVIEMLIKISAEKIIYVSCNSATQARDIFLLSDAYSVSVIQPVDMFPHTHHIENIALLIKK